MFTHSNSDTFIQKNMFYFVSCLPAMEGKVCFSEKRAESLAKEKMCLEAELDAMTKKSHDASGQLVHISQELLKKERYRCQIWFRNCSSGYDSQERIISLIH